MQKIKTKEYINKKSISSKEINSNNINNNKFHDNKNLKQIAYGINKSNKKENNIKKISNKKINENIGNNIYIFKKFKLNIKIIFNHIILELLFIFCPIILSKNIFRNLSDLNQITVVINGSGDQQILNETFKYTPFLIEVNGEEKILTNKILYNLTSNENTILMKFNSNITDCSYMFYNLSNITSIDLSNFDSSNVLNMSMMFGYCKNLSNIIFSNFITINVKDMAKMFYYCSTLKSLDLSNFNTLNTINMTSMFQRCSKMESINIMSFRTPSLRNISYIFAYCNSLVSLDLSKFDISYITDISYMFLECNKLSSLDISSFNTSLVNNMNYLFSGCKSLISLDVSKFNTTSVIYMEGLFSSCNNVISFDLSNFNTSNVKNMGFFFSDCRNLTFINISNFNTSSVISFSHFFSGCSSLISINISNFDTSKVNTMYGFFKNCKKIKSFNLSFFDTSNVTCMWDMFNGCSSLKSLDISSFNTSKVTDMESMFDSCSSLVSLDLSHFNSKNVHYLRNMFQGCSNLEYVNIKNINSYESCFMDGMFYGCSKLKYINIYSINQYSQSITNMFYGASDNFVYCINNETNITNIYNLIKSSNNRIRDCSKNCYPQKRKLIAETNKCVYFNCSENETYKFDYNQECYIKCPKRTYIKEINSTLCEDLNCSNYYNYDQTECINEIPFGYFLNDSILKTVDKCHQDCKTCEKKESIESSNCKSCPSDKYLYLGNCITSCDDYFLDKLDNSSKICKCEDTKCLSCTRESLNYSLCITCNDNYYQKYNDSKNKDNFINCYNNLEGYYLDKNDNFYKPCYPSCKTCEKPGDKKNHNCLECNDLFSFKFYYSNYINCYNNCDYYYYYDNEKNYYFCTEEEKCPTIYNKLIEGKKRCIEDCKKDDEFRYEFKKKCYNKCPLNTKNNNYICKIECPIELPYEIIETQNCVKNCSDSDIENNICILNNENFLLTENKEDEFVNNVQENMENGNYNLTDIENGEEKVYKGNETTCTITTTENQKNNENNNVTTINFGECEDRLHEEYNIPKDKPLFLLKIDVNKTGMKIPKIEYEVYYPLNGDKLEKLNLSICEDTKIDISIPVSINEDDLDKHNSKSGYYNDICYISKSEKGTDITLNDRKKEYVENNYSLCEEDCDFTGYDSKTKKALCSCKVKIKLPLMSEISINKTKLYDSFSNIKNIANMEVMKCYNVLFSKEGIKNNIGCYIIIPIVILHLLCIIIFYLRDYKLIKEIIDKIIYVIRNGKITENNKNIKVQHKRKARQSLTQKKGKPKNKIDYGKTEEKNKIKTKDKKEETRKSTVNNILNKKEEITNKIQEKGDSNKQEEFKNEILEKEAIKNDISKKEGDYLKKNNEKLKNIEPPLLLKYTGGKTIEDTNSEKNNEKLKNIEPPLFLKYIGRKTIKDINLDKIIKNIHSPPIKKLKIQKPQNNYSINALQTNVQAINKNKKNIQMTNNSLNSKSRDKIIDISLLNSQKMINIDYSIMKYNDYELNTLSYNEALNIDKRNYIQYYLSLLKIKHLIIFTFFPSNDYNSRIIKINLFLFSFTIYYAVNALFFNEAAIHQIYEDGGAFNFLYQIPQIIYSSLISSILNMILKTLSLSERNILQIKHEKKIKNLDNTAKDVTKTLNYKFLIYFIISFILLLLFWYYLACFCAIYKNTQLHLIKDSIISFGLSLLYPLGFYLIPGIFRICSLRDPKKNKETIYKFSKIIQLI